jgi:7,8-dihydropterin-6-yl-methyl-4-(beta-D-ribofuranosyl)aminobenzene 5'-phosphate synthase
LTKGKLEVIREIGPLKNASISIIAEDTIEFDTPFWGRFGLSMLLELSSETSEMQILYDTNSSAAPILHNMRILGKSLKEINSIFLLHCHYDHTDGLVGVLGEISRPISVIAHPEIFRPCFEINSDGIRHIGIIGQGRTELEQKGAVFTFSNQPLSLMTGVMTTGEIERITSFEKAEDLYTNINEDVIPDHEHDDMSMLLNFPQGLVIVTGCCHSGIFNTMEHAKKITGVDKVYAVVGGLHLIDTSEEKIEKSVEALREVDWVFAGHCTGFDGIQKMAAALGERLVVFHTGSTIHFPIDDPIKPINTIPTNLRNRHRFS